MVAEVEIQGRALKKMINTLHLLALYSFVKSSFMEVWQNFYLLFGLALSKIIKMGKVSDWLISNTRTTVVVPKANKQARKPFSGTLLHNYNAAFNEKQLRQKYEGFKVEFGSLVKIYLCFMWTAYIYVS